MATSKPGESPPVEAVRLEPFTVEFGDVYCRNQFINCLRLRARGAWSIQRLHQRPGGGRDLGSTMSQMPAIPGQQLRVVPREMKAYLEDPLTEDPQLLETINAVAYRARSIWKGNPFKPVPTVTLSLTNDLLVTLIHELHRKVEAGNAVVIKGRLPGNDQIQKIPGRELYDPLNNGRKPTYVDEVDGWMQRLDQQARV